MGLLSELFRVATLPLDIVNAATNDVPIVGETVSKTIEQESEVKQNNNTEETSK